MGCRFLLLHLDVDIQRGEQETTDICVQELTLVWCLCRCVGIIDRVPVGRFLNGVT